MSMNSYPLTVSSGGVMHLDVVGSFVSVTEATNAFRMTIITKQGMRGRFKMDQGISYHIPHNDPVNVNQGFTRLEIEEIAGAQNTIELLVGSDEIQDNRLNVISSVTVIDGNAATLDGTADNSIAAGAAEVIAAANTNRNYAIIGNPAANAGAFRISGADAAAATGVELLPGEKMEIRGTAAISAWNLGGVAQSISIVEVTS
jgi:hypothetical protein